MSIESEINRISNAKTKIKKKTVELGISGEFATIDEIATAVAGIVNNPSIAAKVKEGETYNIPKGYHDGAGTVQGVGGGGSYELQAKTVSPSELQQVVTTDDGYYGLSSVTVKPIPSNLKDVSSVTAAAADVLVGKVFVNSTGKSTTGTMLNNGDVTKTIDGLMTTSVVIPAGYTIGGTVSLTADIENRLKEI